MQSPSVLSPFLLSQLLLQLSSFHSLVSASSLLYVLKFPLILLSILMQLLFKPSPNEALLVILLSSLMSSNNWH